jgi:hypothetical protein
VIVSQNKIIKPSPRKKETLKLDDQETAQDILILNQNQTLSETSVRLTETIFSTKGLENVTLGQIKE